MMLITGGCGFLGSVLVRTFLQQHKRVRVLDNLLYTGESLLPILGSIQFIKGDIRNPDVCIEALKGVDDVVHLGAIVGENACKKNPTLATETNLYATRQLWELAKDNNVKTFIFASTCSNYGKAELATEETELRPLGHYAKTKVEAEKWLLSQESEMCTTILRFATAFGLSPRMRFDLLINEFLLDAYLCHKLVVYSPNAKRPYCHVRDIANAISNVLFWTKVIPREFDKQVFNVGGFNKTKIEIANYIKTLIHCLEIDVVETDSGRDYAVDFSKLGRYDFTAYTTLESGIKELIDAFPLFDNLLDRKWVNA